MHILENKIPPPIIAILFAFVMWLVSLFFAPVLINSLVRIILAVAVLALGGFFCIAGVVSFRNAKTTVNPLKPEAATSLVNSGIYKVSRNPMYVGFVLFLIAWSVYLSSLLASIGVLGFILYMNRFQILPEERALMELFGEEFEAYKARVRRWI